MRMLLRDSMYELPAKYRYVLYLLRHYNVYNRITYEITSHEHLTSKLIGFMWLHGHLTTNESTNEANAAHTYEH